MNTLREKLRRDQRLHQTAQAQRPAASVSERSNRNAGEHPPEPEIHRPPEKLPDPWLFDSESLLRELDRCRELVLQISIRNANETHITINIAVDALWNLRENLRHLLHLHRDGQREFAKQQAKAERKAGRQTRQAAPSKIVRMRA